jgi:glucose/arabinose dehydrogenase
MAAKGTPRIATWLAALVVAFATVATTSHASATAAKSLPPGFTDTLVADVSRPVALAATPNGRILVVDQVGRVRVIAGGALLERPALDISRKVCATTNERGMLGIAVDPHFASNGYVYVYYTFRKYPACKERAEHVPVNRVSRFTMVGNTIMPSTEKVLIDEMKSYNGNHNAGMVGFGHDGLLYVSVGDGGCDYTMGSHGCGADNTTAQLTNRLQGKILRITPGGDIPATNPFTGTGTARCNHGAIDIGLKCQEIFVLGFRNPFRFAFDPNTTQTRLFANDVGLSTWEEIDSVETGKNYGWNTREGFCATGSTTDCGTPPKRFTNPLFAYAHSTGCQVVTGAAFVPNGSWGAQYDDGYLYSDYSCGKIFLLQPDGSGHWDSTEFATGLGHGGPVAMLFAEHGASTALYYTTLARDGQVRVIDQT